jgi:hypothetical protein
MKYESSILHPSGTDGMALQFSNFQIHTKPTRVENFPKCDEEPASPEYPIIIALFVIVGADPYKHRGTKSGPAGL